MAKDVYIRPTSISFLRICQSPAIVVVVVACLRGVFFVNSLIAACACSLGFCSLRKQFIYASRGFYPNGGKQRCGCFRMRHKLVRAVRLMAFMTTVIEERSGFVWLTARATGMTVEIDWKRKLVTGSPGEKKWPHCSQNCCATSERSSSSIDRQYKQYENRRQWNIASQLQCQAPRSRPCANWSGRCMYGFGEMGATVKLQIFVRYLFSYFRLETGSYVLIFVLLRVCEKNDVETQWLQSKKKFSYGINFVLFQKYEMYENKYRTKICDFTVFTNWRRDVGVCGALLYTGACWMYGWLREAVKNSSSESYFMLLLLEYALGDTYRLSLCSKNLKNQATEWVRARY